MARALYYNTGEGWRPVILGRALDEWRAAIDRPSDVLSLRGIATGRYFAREAREFYRSAMHRRITEGRSLCCFAEGPRWPYRRGSNPP